MKTVSVCVLGFFAVMTASSQTVQFPTVPIAAPGTAGPSAVMLTGLSVGLTAEVVTSISERCVPPQTSGATASTAAVAGLADFTCTPVSGNPRLLMRQGGLLTRTGDSLLPSERQVTTQQNVLLGSLTEGVDLLQEGNSGPQIRQLARVETPDLSCAVQSGSGQAVLTRRGIAGFTFNDPLNVLYVETVHSRTHYSAPIPGATAPQPCTAGSVTTGGIPFLLEVTRTLVRVTGFNNTRPF